GNEALIFFPGDALGQSEPPDVGCYQRGRGRPLSAFRFPLFPRGFSSHHRLPMTLPFPVSASRLGAWTWAFGLSVAAAGLNLRAADPEVDPAELPRVRPKEPAQAGATFRVKPGFRFDLVAAEPRVISPVALSFDENGRLYVVEMRDYSERRPERLGRIRLL